MSLPGLGFPGPRAALAGRLAVAGACTGALGGGTAFAVGAAAGVARMPDAELHRVGPGGLRGRGLGRAWRFVALRHHMPRRLRLDGATVSSCFRRMWRSNWGTVSAASQ